MLIVVLWHQLSTGLLQCYLIPLDLKIFLSFMSTEKKSGPMVHWCSYGYAQENSHNSFWAHPGVQSLLLWSFQRLILHLHDGQQLPLEIFCNVNLYYGVILFCYCGVPPISRSGNHVGYNDSFRQGSVAVLDLNYLSDIYIAFWIQRKMGLAVLWGTWSAPLAWIGLTDLPN